MLNTIYPDYLKRVIEHAVDIRNKPEDNEEKKEFILISDDWYEQLMSHPYISSKLLWTYNNAIEKPGSTIHLLK